MDKRDMDFDGWFELLCMNLFDDGIVFQDADSVREDYEKGADLFAVVDAIKDEYA